MNDDIKRKRQEANRLAEQINSEGINLDLLLQAMSKKNLQIINLNKDAHRKFVQVYDKINSQNYPQSQKGKLLEDLTGILFQEGYPSLFDVRRNERTSSNEIDLQINWTRQALLANLSPEFTLGRSFLCECKNYEKKVSVTYVGKFFSLLSYTKTKLGILVAWNGITGKSDWSDSKGLIKKVALAENRFILTIDKYDFERIYNQSSNIFAILGDKYLSLKNDIDYKEFLKEAHPLEKKDLWEFPDKQ